MAKGRELGRDRRRTESEDGPKWLGDRLDRMEEEMRLSGFSRQTRRLYRSHVKRFYLRRTNGVNGHRKLHRSGHRKLHTWRR